MNQKAALISQRKKRRLNEYENGENRTLSKKVNEVIYNQPTVALPKNIYIMESHLEGAGSTYVRIRINNRQPP